MTAKCSRCKWYSEDEEAHGKLHGIGNTGWCVNPSTAGICGGRRSNTPSMTHWGAWCTGFIERGGQEDAEQLTVLGMVGDGADAIQMRIAAEREQRIGRCSDGAGRGADGVRMKG